MAATRDADLRGAIRSADLVIPDGAGVAWASRRLRQPVAERIAGADFLEDLAGAAASESQAIFLLGSAPGVAERAGRRLQALHPGLRVAGTRSGSPSFEEAPGICEQVRRSRARLLAVAFGVPAQDLWLEQHLERTGAAVGIGVGGTLDYLAGDVARAPKFLRRAGLEWLFRLARQPWRLSRMLRGAPFFWQVWRTPRRGGVHGS